MLSYTRSIISYVGIFLMIIGLIILIPIIYVIFDDSEFSYIHYFVLPGVGTIFMGYVLYYFNKQYHDVVTFNRNSFWLIIFIWMIAIFVTALPFSLLDNYHLSHAIFESTSGLSTTGLSVFDVENTPKIFLLYRSELQFVGGVGLVLVFVSLLSKQNSYAIYTAEGHEDQLSPNLVKSARRIIFIYLIYIFIGTLLLTFSKMSFFDAINHAIAAISTGGFSTRVGSIYEYNNIFVEGVIMVLMLLGGTNFLVHYYMMTGHIKKVYKHIELYYVLGIIFILVPIMALVISNSLGLSYFSGIRVGLFEFISAATTTGFTASAGYQVFPSIFIFIMILLMVIGGGIGSTAGGIKQFRVIVLFKSIYWYFKESISSNRLMFQKKIYKVDHEEEISSKQLNNTFVFVFIYILFLIVGTSLFMILDNSLMDSLFETASALGTVGLSVGLFTYESPLFVLWFGSFLMLLGRLEILIVLITITNFIHKIFSRK